MAASLDPELEAGLRRLKLRRVRELAPELLKTARTQRWRPEELLGTLVREEVAARDASNLALRLKRAQFPAPKTLAGFDPRASQLPEATFAFLTSLEWLERSENLLIAGPAGTGKSHLGQALGRACVEAGHRVRCFGADELVEALYRGLADNSVGKLIGGLLRYELVIVDDLGFTAMDRTAAEHLFRFVAAAYERRSLIVGTNVALERWTESLPDETVATAILDRLLHHCHVDRARRRELPPARGAPGGDTSVSELESCPFGATDWSRPPRAGPQGASQRLVHRGSGQIAPVTPPGGPRRASKRLHAARGP